MKKFWIFLFAISLAALVVLSGPSLEVYMGWNMPFVQINENTFIVFGRSYPDEQQLGVVLITALLMMVPARTLSIAWIKLFS